MTTRGGARRPPWRVVATVAAAILLLNVLVGVAREIAGGPKGPTSSSYATAPDGLAAYAELLRRSGHPVERVHDDARALDESGTVIVLDPQTMSGSDVVALRRFVEDGGRLVAGGTEPNAWVEQLLPEAPEWTPGGVRTYGILAPAPEVAGITSLLAVGTGSWSDAAGTLPIVGREDESLAVVASLGRGRAVLLADASVLQNRLLDEADNAAFGLAAAGGPERPVYFLEHVHGSGTGLGALPERWRWGLGGAVLAALVWMLARSRRLGPPEQASRSLPPPRRAYVDALAASLQRARRPAEAAAPLQAAARDLVRRHGADDADETSVRRLGLSDDEVRAVVGPVRDERDVVALGRAFARLQRASR